MNLNSKSILNLYRTVPFVLLALFASSLYGADQKPSLYLFQVDRQQELQWKALRSNRNVRILNYDPTQYQILKQNKYTEFNLLMPGLEGSDIEVELIENKVISEDFVLSTEKSRNLAYAPGLYYSGKIKGQDQSMVVISFFENEVMGMISISGRSNLVLGNSPALRRNSFILFDEGQVDQPEFTCLSTELPNWTKDLNTTLGSFRHQQSAANCIKVYFECGLSVFEGKGSIAGAANFVTSLFNAVSTLYIREGIATNISEIKVWTSQEPYGNDSNSGLEDFGNALQGNFNGDLAHFLRLKSGTFNGLAWLDILCKTNRYAYSEVSTNYTVFPTYSWTVNVVTHEMGHNLGSPHTQSCTWIGGALDDCANSEGTCSPGPSPSNGGTIMSYCHQITSIGVNFNNGFGPQPGDRIRSRFNGATCLTACGGSGGGETLTLPDLVINNVSASQGTLNSPDASSTMFITTSNAGTNLAIASQTTAFFSIDNALSVDDLTLININIPTLNTGASISNNFSFSFSSNTQPGTYFILVCADQANAVAESSEANNCKSTTIVLSPPTTPVPTPPGPSQLPDLVLSISSAIPGITLPGSSLTIGGSISNQGPGNAIASLVNVVLSTDGQYSNDDIQLASTNIPSLDVQGSKSFNNSVILPSGLLLENYQLIICSDPGNVIVETNESNNCKAFAIKIFSEKADLLPHQLIIGPNPSPSGSPFKVSFNTINQGSINSSSYWTGVYLSKNNKTKDASDLLLGLSLTPQGLAANQSRADQFSVTSLINPGIYTILVCTDDQNHIIESNETNNCAAISITISNPLPDLLVHQLISPTSFFLGDTQTIRCIIKNDGYIKAAAAKAKLVLSPTSAIGTNSLLIAEIDIPALGINESIEKTVKTSISEAKWSGNHFFILCTDTDQGIKESDDANNCKENPVFIKELLPDIKLISKTSFVQAIAKGTVIHFPLAITNIGHNTAPASETEFYISDKSLFKASNSIRLYVDTLDLIQPGDTIKKDLVFPLSNQLTPGSYYLNICTDYKLKIKEESEGNNCQSYRIQIRNLYADISIHTFELNEEKLYSNIPSSVRISILNSGEIPIKTIDLEMVAYTHTDTFRLVNLLVDSLDSGLTWDTSFSLILPPGKENQEVRLVLQADPSNTHAEINETNNIAELTKFVYEPLPDLYAFQFLQIDTAIRSGDSVIIHTVLGNQGLVASPEFSISFWLIDTTQNKNHPDSTLLSSILHSEMLPGQLDSIQSIVLLPQSTLSGNYQVWLVLDNDNTIKESSESNNTQFLTLPVIQRLPDITAIDLLIPEQLIRNQTLTGILYVQNLGDWQMPALMETLYLSKDSVRSADDFAIGNFNIPALNPGGNIFAEMTWSIPDQVQSGSQFLLLTLDDNNLYKEHLKSNNSLITTILVPNKKADLSLTGLQLATSNIHPGDTLTITNYINNIGETNAGGFNLLQYIKKHPLDSQYVYRFPVSRIQNGLQAGQEYLSTLRIILPDSIHSNSYYLISCLDTDDEIDELRKDNNCGQLIVNITSKQGISTGLKRDPLFVQFKTFPNPVAHFLHLKGTPGKPLNQIQLLVKDYTGRTLLRKPIHAPGEINISLDLAHLPAGLYYIDLTSLEGTWKQSFIKL